MKSHGNIQANVSGRSFSVSRETKLLEDTDPNGGSDQCGNNFIGIYKAKGLLFIIRLQTVFIRKYNRKVSILHDGSLSGTDYTAFPIKNNSYRIFSASRA